MPLPRNGGGDTVILDRSHIVKALSRRMPAKITRVFRFSILG
jgi:hypothetical protein